MPNKEKTCCLFSNTIVLKEEKKICAKSLVLVYHFETLTFTDTLPSYTYFRYNLYIE